MWIIAKSTERLGICLHYSRFMHCGVFIAKEVQAFCYIQIWKKHHKHIGKKQNQGAKCLTDSVRIKVKTWQPNWSCLGVDSYRVKVKLRTSYLENLTGRRDEAVGALTWYISFWGVSCLSLYKGGGRVGRMRYFLQGKGWLLFLRVGGEGGRTGGQLTGSSPKGQNSPRSATIPFSGTNISALLSQKPLSVIRREKI